MSVEPEQLFADLLRIAPEAKGTDDGSFTVSPMLPAKPTIQKLRYSHKAMIDLIIANPGIKQGEIARAFGKTDSWISIIINSDAFQAELERRKDEVIDPILRITVEENLRGLMMRSLDIIKEKLDVPASAVPDQLALQTLALTSRAAGYGARSEVRVEVGVSAHIESHGDQLVALLRRKKVEVLDGEVEDAQIQA